MARKNTTKREKRRRTRARTRNRTEKRKTTKKKKKKKERERERERESERGRSTVAQFRKISNKPSSPGRPKWKKGGGGRTRGRRRISVQN